MNNLHHNPQIPTPHVPGVPGSIPPPNNQYQPQQQHQHNNMNMSMNMDMTASYNNMKVPRKQQQHLHNPSQNLVHNNFAHPAASNSSLVTSISSNQNHAANAISAPSLAPQPLVAPPASLNMPPGVFIPASIDPSLILASPKAMELLHSLSPQQMQDSLREFDDAMRSKGGKVRNITAYLIGVFKRYVNVNSKQRKSGAPVMTEGLTPIVRVTLQKIVDTGFCTKAEISDPKVEQKIKMLSEHDAVLAVDELSSVPRETIRNFASYFAGILNRYQMGHGGKSGDKRGGQARRDDRRLDRDRDRHRRSPSRDSYDDDRRRYRSRRNRSHSDDYSHSPSPDRNHRRRSRRDRSRSRSRDRFDGDGGGGRRDRYGGGSGSGSRRSRRSRSPSPGRHGGRNSHSNHHSSHQYSSNANTQHRGSTDPSTNAPIGLHAHQQQPAQMMFGAPPSGGAAPMLSNSIMSIPPPPPPPRGNMVLQPPAVQYQFQQQQQQQQQNAQVQLQPWQQQLQPLAPGPTYGTNTFTAATSALTATPASFAPHNVTHPTAQITTAPALDILGLAEKAAQALSGIPGLVTASAPRADPRQHQNTEEKARDPRAQNYSHIPQQQSYSHAPQQQNHNHNHNHNSEREEDVNVSVSDLPPMVQYAVQNLRSSGHLEKDLGQNACRWLKQLSEPMSLKALERFSSCDVTQMRSKEGYLCGILKKAVDQRG